MLNACTIGFSLNSFSLIDECRQNFGLRPIQKGDLTTEKVQNFDLFVLSSVIEYIDVLSIICYRVPEDRLPRTSRIEFLIIWPKHLCSRKKTTRLTSPRTMDNPNEIDNAIRKPKWCLFQPLQLSADNFNFCLICLIITEEQDIFMNSRA